MVIPGGASTLPGPIVGAAIVMLVKNVVSTYVERWNTLLGVIFVVVIIFMPRRAGARLPAAVAARRDAPQARRRRQDAAVGAGRMTAPALEVTGLNKRFGGLPATKNVSLTVDARRAPADHRPERRRQDHAVQPDHRRAHRRQRLGQAVRPGAARHAEPPAARISAWRAPTRSSRCSRSDTLVHNVVLALLGLDKLRWNPVGRADRPPASLRRRRARRWRRSASPTAPSASSPRPPTASAGGSRSPWRWRRSRRCCCSTSRSPACRSDERRDVRDAARHDPARRHHRDDRARHGHRARLRRAHHAAALRRGDRRRHPRRGGRRPAHAGGLSWPLSALSSDGHRRLLRRQPRAARRVVRAQARPAARPARPQRRRQDHLHEHRSWASSAARAARSALFGEPVARLPPEAIARKGICLVPQGRRMFRSLTVRENLMVAAQRSPSAGSGTRLDHGPRVRHVPAAEGAPRARSPARCPAASSRCWRSAAR